MADLRRAITLSPQHLPSIATFTFLNARNQLSSISISSDVSHIAAGVNDSSIRLWVFSPPHQLPDTNTTTSGMTNNNDGGGSSNNHTMNESTLNSLARSRGGSVLAKPSPLDHDWPNYIPPLRAKYDESGPQKTTNDNQATNVHPSPSAALHTMQGLLSHPFPNLTADIASGIVPTTGKVAPRLHKLVAHSAPVTSMAFSPDMTYMLSASQVRSIYNSQRTITTLEADSNKGHHIPFCPSCSLQRILFSPLPSSL